MLNNFLISIDNFSVNTGLLVDGNKKFKHIIGGILTIITSITVVVITSLFFLQFIRREKSTIITNIEFTNKVQIDNFKRIPFMIRLSASGNLVIEENYKVWKVIAARWGTRKNDTKQFSEAIIMEKCNLDKHFGEYRNLFEDMKDIDTFVCPVYLEDDSLYGLYGDTDPYSFYNFAIRPCINELDGGICDNEKSINKFLNQVFLDIRTVDFVISNFDIKPFKPIARGKRFSVSKSIFRRIWMNFRSVSYNTDFGLVLDENNSSDFHQIDGFDSEVDMRDQKTNVTPYTFLWLTLSNTPSKINYFRSYMKFQEFLASVGGFIKAILYVVYFFYDNVSSKLYYTSLINSLITNKNTTNELRFEEIKKIDSSIDSEFIRNKSIRIINNNNSGKKNSKNFSPNEELKSLSIFNLKWSQLIFPVCFNKNSLNYITYVKGRKIVYQMLDIKYYLRQLSQLDYLENLILPMYTDNRALRNNKDIIKIK